MIVITKDRQAEIDALNDKIVELALMLAKANGKIATLTEQLRLANEDAERLANAFEIVCGLVDESGILVDRYALRLHEERITQDR